MGDALFVAVKKDIIIEPSLELFFLRDSGHGSSNIVGYTLQDR
jgi:hypothetical protein